MGLFSGGLPLALEPQTQVEVAASFKQANLALYLTNYNNKYFYLTF
jgi:hypothetical protein